MERREPPSWWVALQSTFSQALRAPLSGVATERVEHALAAHVVEGSGPRAAARVRLYRQQYWFRLFDLVRHSFPRVALTVGDETLLRLSAAYFAAIPPSGGDLADAADAFFRELLAALDAIAPLRASNEYRVVDTPVRELARVALKADARTAAHLSGAVAEIPAPWSLLAQAAHIDEAVRRASRAPFVAPWAPSGPVSVAALADHRARFCPSFSLLRADWGLPDVEIEVEADAREAAPDEATPPRPSVTPPRLAAPEHRAVHRSERGVLLCRLDAVLARVLARMRAGSTLGEAVTHVEALAPPALRGRVREAVDAQLRFIVERGFWAGIDS